MWSSANRPNLDSMKKLLLLICLSACRMGYAQVTVDTTSGNVIVKEKTGKITKSLSIYTMFAEHCGKCSDIVYDPNSGDYGAEPDTLYLNFANELIHIRTMLDTALIYRRKYDFYRFACNLAPYRDLGSKLADIFSNSAEWNDYLKKAGNLLVADTLFDGNELVELRYDPVLAAQVLDKSDFVQTLNDFFKPYGYKVTANGFPADHQQTLSRNELRSLGKPESLIVPIPNGGFALMKLTGEKRAPKKK